MARGLGAPASGRHRAGARNLDWWRSIRAAGREERLSSVCAVRMTISLPDEQAKRLAELCRDEGISRAEAVRRAVDRYLAVHRHRGEVFGIWRGRVTEGLAFERLLREEWR